jgi:hypothetical protein
MRTTVRIDDHLFQQAKRAAADSHRTLAAIIEDALRLSLQRQSGAPAKRPPFRMRTFKGNGVRPGVNLDSNAELLDIMEGHGPSGR